MAHQVYQRDGSDLADITITGYYNGSPVSIEARWNGGAWAEIDAAPSAGLFSGTLTNQSVGRGTLEVRFSNDTGKTVSVANVGIGDVFAIAGQSNASGRGTNNQSYSHATVMASMHKNNYTWAELEDPTDDATGQQDSVSKDTGAAGSCWPLVATEFLADQGVPIAFINCAEGGSAISEWEPWEEDHESRNTLYGSLVHRAKNVAGGVKAVLWYQGESDVVLGTSQAAYNASLDTIADAIQADLGCKLMAALIHDFAGYDESAVNAAITEAQGDNANVLVGPDFSGFVPYGDLHFVSDADLQKMAGAGANVGWWDAMKAEWY